MMPYQVRNVFLVYEVKMTLHVLLHTIKRHHRFIGLLQNSLNGALLKDGPEAGDLQRHCVVSTKKGNRLTCV